MKNGLYTLGTANRSISEKRVLYIIGLRMHRMKYDAMFVFFFQGAELLQYGYS